LRYRQKQEQNSVQVHEIPFRETRQELIAAVNGGLKETVGDDMANAIVDLIRPYRHGGDDTLCALHDIDIDDKHMLIIPIVRATKVIVEHVTIGGIVMKNCTLKLGASGQINVMAFGAYKELLNSRAMFARPSTYFSKTANRSGESLLSQRCTNWLN
jgi:hypothetical protein